MKDRVYRNKRGNDVLCSIIYSTVPMILEVVRGHYKRRSRPRWDAQAELDRRAEKYGWPEVD